MRLHLVMMIHLSKLGHFSLAFVSETKSVSPEFFSTFPISNLCPNFRRIMKEISMWKDFCANVLKYFAFLFTFFTFFLRPYESRSTYFYVFSM